MSQLLRYPPWELGQAGSAKSVQRAYVNCRLHALNNSTHHQALLNATLQALRALPRFQNAKEAQLLAAIAHMTRRLQSADLTINFKATDWFTNENTWVSYQQMYENGIQADGGMLLKDKPQNPARTRSGADDVATFPKTWGMKARNIGPEGFQYAREELPLPGRGLSPNAAKNRVIAKMSPGPLVRRDSRDGYIASNDQFDPRTKQVFAALNYGRRVHGSTTRYGFSHFVLDDKFKADALYYAGDTFYAEMYRNSAEHQLSYALLGLIYDKANNHLRQDLVRSCLDNASLLSTGDEAKLLEAHLFGSVKFHGNIKTVYISGRDCNTPDLFQTVQTNARKFAQKHGAKIVFVT
jgi:hypothetical protein